MLDPSLLKGGLSPFRSSCAVGESRLCNIPPSKLIIMARNDYFEIGRGGPRGLGTLIFSYITRLGPFYFLFKILNFNIFGFSKK